MTAFDIVKAPIFFRDIVKRKRRRVMEPVNVLMRVPIKLPPLDPDRLSTPQEFGEQDGLFLHSTEIMARCSQPSGQAYTLEDLRELERCSAEDLVDALVKSPRHPYAPVLDDEMRNLAVIERDWGSQCDKALAWLQKLASVEGDIYAPIPYPCLAISLDTASHQLKGQAVPTPRQSPALLLPTLYLPLDMPASVPDDIRRVIDLPWAGRGIPHSPSRQGLGLPPSDRNYWAVRTFAGLFDYLELKGSELWPGELPYGELAAANAALRRVERHEVSHDWIGLFLGAEPDRFGSNSQYIQALQSLLRAYYAALDEPVPPDASELSGLTL
ncbi:hypothetical protein [Pelagibacterium luteolum]|uniref:Uncharacterized protein n=1 Tax=Pelagibacterium luteolum TaxID=440168 RepID=A0A1G7XWW9_9HYPH|nr:hypothetical protein [Pelagibacterium luteolum]SDG88516.1 hypothetical protein SAMN04487974_11144 [Pelagibacterium luteolum]